MNTYLEIDFESMTIKRYGIEIFEDITNHEMEKHFKDVNRELPAESVLGSFLRYCRDVNDVQGTYIVEINELALYIEMISPSWSNFGNGCFIKTSLINSQNWDLSLDRYSEVGKKLGWEDKFGKYRGDFIHDYLPPYSKKYIEEYGLENLYNCYFKD